MSSYNDAINWKDVERVVVHTSKFLGFDGEENVGGRTRLLSELLSVIREEFKRPVVVVQKGRTNFEVTSPGGYSVIGIKAPLNAKGDPILGRRLQKMLRPTDGLVYGSGAQGGWPYFQRGAKGIQHGIGWDGPYSRVHRTYHETINLSFARAMRSILCVDTNYINWLRQHGEEGLTLAAKCEYLPNYADTSRLPVANDDVGPHCPMRLLYARRYERKRGPLQFLDALEELRRLGVSFEARMFSVGGHDELQKELTERDLVGCVTLAQASLDEILPQMTWADVSIIPTIWSEGTSLSAVESLCAGVPVVTTPVGGLANLIVPGFNGFIVKSEGSELARAVAQYRDESLYQSHRSAALSMREALGIGRWRSAVLGWLMV